MIPEARMYIKKYLWILIVIIFVIPMAGFSQDRLTFTLEKSVEVALKKNPEIKIAEKEIRKANAGRLEAWSNILPRLDGSVNFQHAWDIQQQTIPNFLKPMLKPLEPFIPELALMPDYVTMSFGMQNTLIYGATVSQPLFLGGAGIAGIQMANSAKRAAEQNLEETKQSLIYNTTNTFYACLLSKELVKVQEEALAQTKANLDNVIKKYNVGSASGFDKMRAQVELANLKPGVITAKNNHKSALTMLKTVLGLDRDSKIEVVGEFKYIEDNFGKMTLDELQKLAYEFRPIIKALTNQKRIVKKGITIARSNFLPKLFFSTDYSYMLMKNDYKFRHAEASKGFTSALSLQIPLFHGFQSSAQYQKSNLDYKIILDTEKQAYDGIAAETEVALNKFQEANEKYLSAVQTVDLAKEALRLANMMYEEGVNTQLDILSSQLALTQAKLNYTNSIYEYQISRYQMRKVVGMLKGVLDN